MKKALILAAGVGKRLGELTKDIPKCLLPLGKETILDTSLKALKENGISDVTFITGFAHEKLTHHIRQQWSNTFYFQFIYNDKFDVYNNVYSAYLAKEIWDDETILLNSDIIFHQDILKKLSSNLKESQSFLVIDDTKKLIDEDMKIKTDSTGAIKEISKKLNNSESSGEYIGIMCLKGFERISFLQSLENCIKNKKFDLYYEDALSYILEKVTVHPCSTLGKPWTEVDTKDDYQYAMKIQDEIKKIPLNQ